MKVSKDEYILRNFSKIKHKKWELFVITRIIHSLNDPEIEFVCQQLIKPKSGKRYLADLCFPSLKLYYEIDELQHSSEQHKISDQIRQREIVDATDFVERRIRVYDSNKNDRKLGEVITEVDGFIEFVRHRKNEFVSNGDFTPWDYDKKFSPDAHIERGYIDVKDNVVFNNHRDALKCFGYRGGHYQRARWNIDGTKKGVWFPKLYENDHWDNHLSDDFKTIVMKNKSEKLSSPEEFEWIVFAHYKDLLGQIVYKFLGEFHLVVDKSNNSQWVFARRKTKIIFDDLAG